MNWRELQAGTPDLAALAREHFERAGMALVGTLRRDGSPASPASIRASSETTSSSR